jgi:hypothetical protein
MMDRVMKAHPRANCAVVGAIALVALSGAVIREISHYADDLRTLASLPDHIFVTESPIALVKAENAAQAQCLAEVMYYEARGEGIEGQKAVAEVVLQRTYDRDYPATVCGVVYDGVQPDRRDCQFSFACDGTLLKPKDSPVWGRMRLLADKIVSGAVKLSGETGHAIAYHNMGVAPAWAETMLKTAEIGNHIFYKRDPSAQVRLAQLQPEQAQGASGVYLPAPADPSEEIQPHVQAASAVGDGA